ncbi:MAG: HEPN domain-containing protein [Deltaproteobacteria bacterium]|nr:HEPN domain-containing protein [Deltaproteobacteria bacterium]
MVAKEILYKKEYAEELLRIAEGDCKSAGKLFAAGGGRPENVCFIAQQAIEKSIKSVLCYHQIAYPHTHDLNLLLKKLPPKVQAPSGYELGVLTEYATVRRYEEGIVELSRDDLQLVLDITTKVVVWAQKCIRDS